MKYFVANNCDLVTFYSKISAFLPTMSVAKTPTYNLAKFLVPLLEPITTNMYTVKISFEFAKEISDEYPGLSWPVWMSAPSLPRYHYRRL